jgi:hypothetical protein
VCATCGLLRQLLIDRGMAPNLAMSIGAAAGEEVIDRVVPVIEKKVKKKASAYNRKYKAAFKKISSKYKLKSGKWKANGFKRAVKEAHRIAGGKKR